MRNYVRSNIYWTACVLGRRGGDGGSGGGCLSLVRANMADVRQIHHATEAKEGMQRARFHFALFFLKQVGELR